MRLDHDVPDPKVSLNEPHQAANIQSLSPIAAFPTSNQPVLDTLLKDMLISLNTTSQAEFSNIAKQFTAEVHLLGSRVHRIENA